MKTAYVHADMPLAYQAGTRLIVYMQRSYTCVACLHQAVRLSLGACPAALVNREGGLETKLHCRHIHWSSLPLLCIGKISLNPSASPYPLAVLPSQFPLPT